MTPADFHDLQPLLYGLAWRMTGDAADAEEIVQETAVKLLQHPPPDPSRPLRPYAVTLALNLARDRLRRRRARRTRGVWLPSALATGPDTPEASLALQQTATTAWLLAAEALSPQQRSVLLLREVWEHSTEETAALLGTSTTAVKVALHRAHAALRDARPPAPTPAQQAACVAAMTGFFQAIHDGDVAAAQAWLEDDVIVRSDGGGRYLAAAIPIVGAARVARMYLHFARRTRVDGLSLVSVNQLPALLLAQSSRQRSSRPFAPLALLSVTTSPEGRITAIFSSLTPERWRGVVTQGG